MDLEELEQAYESLRRDHLATQEMLGLVLRAIDRPVFVADKLIKEGLSGKEIAIEQMTEPLGFMFSIGNKREDDTV